MQISKAHKLRLYPNRVQEERLWQIIHGCRFVWNYYLSERKDAYLKRAESMNYTDCAKQLTVLKKNPEFQWLDELPVHPLQQSLRDLDVAFNKFFRRQSLFPKFKSRKSRAQSLRIPAGWKLRDSKIQIERNLVISIRGTLPIVSAILKSLTVKYENGKWFAVILTQQEIEPKQKTGEPIGVDLGLTDLVVNSNGNRYQNLKSHQTMQGRIKKLSQDLARKQKGSKRREKAKQLLTSLHRNIANQRMNHLHQTTHRITSENQAVIVCEDLSVKNMMRNHKLATGIADASWGEFIRQLEYKQAWRGGKLVKIDRFFPSSKTCSKCNYIVDKLPLSIRKWTCQKCGQEHDRDINAAKNILRQYRPEEQVGVESKESSRRKPVRVACSVKRRVNTTVPLDAER